MIMQLIAIIFGTLSAIFVVAVQIIEFVLSLVLDMAVMARQMLAQFVPLSRNSKNQSDDAPPED